MEPVDKPAGLAHRPKDINDSSVRHRDNVAGLEDDVVLRVALFEQDRILDAKVLMLGALQEFDGRWIIHYNLACADARLGEPEPAFEHLREALEKRPQLAENAKDDPDLESLHDDERFDELLAAVPS